MKTSQKSGWIILSNIMILLLLFFSATNTFANSYADLRTNESISETISDKNSDSSKAAKIDSLVKNYAGENVPGGAIMVSKNGEVILMKSFGMADLTHRIPFSADTPTNIGSTSKQFTAFALALLADQGKLSLDDDIRMHIPEIPEFDHVVTIRNILTHTSGYREFLNLLAMTGRNMTTPLSEEQLIRIVQRQSELQNKPGAEFNYNNTGYSLASIIVERVTDTPFHVWTRDNIFAPLGMNNTQFRTSPGHVIPGRAQGYLPSAEEKIGYIETADLGGAIGPGGIYSTMNDLLKWVQNFKTYKVGNERVFNEMLTPYILESGVSTQYGLGIFVQEYKGLKYYHHGGADVAHRSMLMYYPEIDAAIVTQSNNATFSGAINSQIADIYFDAYFKNEDAAPEDKLAQTSPDADSAEKPVFVYNIDQFDILAGRYELAIMPGFILTFARDGDRIYTQATGQPKINIEATSDSTFRLIGVDAALTFHLNADGSADSLTLHQNGHHIARIIQWRPNPDEMKSYSGVYISKEIETIYTVSTKNDSLVLKHYQFGDIALNASNKDQFSGSFPMLQVDFVRNEAGEIVGFNASSGRTRGVYFEKQ